MYQTETINSWAEDNSLELGDALLIILKYLVDDPRIIGANMRRALHEATEQEIIDAMETAADDIADVGKEKVML